MEGKLRIGVSQLDANKVNLNSSATWMVDKWFSKVGRDLAVPAAVPRAPGTAFWALLLEGGLEHCPLPPTEPPLTRQHS